MEKSEYQKLYELETTYWWHVGRRHLLEVLLEKFLPKKETKILDIGCGTGENLKFLSRFGKVMGIDKSPQAVKFSKKRGIKNIRLGQAENLAFEEGSFDLVTMLDLLEHLKDDFLALGEAFRVLKPGGILVATAPSYQFLWSEHDEALDHKRRYSRGGLEAKIQKAGFEIKKLSFAITVLFPLMFFYRRFQKVFVKSTIPKTSYVILPNWLNNFFIGLLRLEAQALKYTNLPFGVSLICVAERIHPERFILKDSS